MTVYISGPISGYPDGNLPAFLRARKDIMKNPGMKAIVPHEVVAPIVATEQARLCPAYCWCACMVALLPVVENVDAIFMLPDFPLSRGARREFSHAIDHGIRILNLPVPKNDFITKAFGPPCEIPGDCIPQNIGDPIPGGDR